MGARDATVPLPHLSSGHRAATHLPGTFLRGQPAPHAVAFVPREGVVGALAPHGAAGADALGQAHPQPEVLPLLLLRWEEQLMVGRADRRPGRATTRDRAPARAG